MLEYILSRAWQTRLVLLVAWSLAGIQAPAVGADLVFKRHVINAGTDYSAAAVIDVNRDGKLDIVCGGEWYESPDWTRHFVRHVPRIRDRPDGFAHLTLDVNRDGWTDIITVNYRSSSIQWIQHPGATLGPWTAHLVVEPGPMETGRLVDIDGDGQVDLLPNGARFAAWFELDWDSESNTNAPKWIRHDLPAEAGGHGLGFGDIDGDGRGDIVGQFGWLKAPDEPRSGRWHWNPEFHLERASIPMIVADADDDGDSDIIWSSAHGFGVYWLEQVSIPDQGRSWIRHAIDTSWSQGHAPLWVDFDGDGRNEFVAGKRYLAHGGADPGAYDPLAVYRYQFDPEPRTWQRFTISFGERVGLGLDPKAADMDGDGDLDLVASGRSGLYLLENLGANGRVHRKTAIPEYQDRTNLSIVKDELGREQAIESAEDWGRRRSHIIASIEDSLGPLPGSASRVPLDIRVAAESVTEAKTQRSIRYRVDAERRVAANLIIPRDVTIGEMPAILCMFATPDTAEVRSLTEAFVQRGYVCLVPRPTPPSDMHNALWKAMRAVDVLQSLLEVHGERIAFIGDAQGGQLPLFLAALDQRLIATVAANAVHTPSADERFSTSELVAAVAPRSLWIQATAHTALAAKLNDAATRAASVFKIRQVADNLRVVDHSSSVNRRDDMGGVFEWLDGRLKRTRRFGGLRLQRGL